MREAFVLGFRRRYAGEEAGITQAELAQRLGVTQQAVEQAERWDSNPAIAFISRWADA
jgi:DNA-binding XRE family transcriptional regulator